MQQNKNSGFTNLVLTGLERCNVPLDSKILVSCSGGSDSTALLLALKYIADKSNLFIKVAHFNHGIREQESDLDEQFVSDLCDDIGISLITERAPEKINNESVMRKHRYNFLAKTLEQNKLQYVLTGHTKDDQAETVLLNIVRGAGIRGSGGIPEVSVRNDISRTYPIVVVRPMLRIRKFMTQEYCNSLQIKPREDSSNLDTKFKRNLIRHKIMPELKLINPGIVDALNRLSINAQSDRRLIQSIVTNSIKDLGEGNLRRNEILKIPDELLGHILINKYDNVAGTTDGLSMEHVDSMVRATKSHAGIRLDLPNNIQFIVEHTYISFVNKNDNALSVYPESRKNEIKIQFPGETTLANNLVIKTRIIPRPNILKPRSRWHTYANACLKNLDLKVRHRKKGDRFYPMGMNVDVSLQDFFVNQHVPRTFRDQVPLLTCENGIIWVTGHRLAEWAKVDDHSKNVSEFEVKNSIKHGPGGNYE